MTIGHSAKPRRRESGLTLIEIIVTLAVLGVVTAVVARPLVDLVQARIDINQATGQQADLDHTLARMSAAIRRDTDGVECESSSLTASGQDYTYNAVDGTITVNTQVLLSNVSEFSCAEVDGVGGLYQLEMTASNIEAEVRAFRRGQ